MRRLVARRRPRPQWRQRSPGYRPIDRVMDRRWLLQEDCRALYLRMRDTYYQTVGTLYPGIIYRELMDLRAMFLRIGGPEELLPWVRPPGGDGRAGGWR